MASAPPTGRGILRMWDDEKGFGFIDPEEGGADVFVHITAFVDRGVQPEIGALLSYVRTKDDEGRPRAAKVRVEKGASASNRQRGVSSTPRRMGRERTPISSPEAQAKFRAAWGVTFFLLLVAGAAALGYLSTWVPALYAGMSCLTFIAYRMDKARAEKDERRVPENTLHLLELLGGWPGALVAQQWLRHKTGKVSYQVIFWLIVMAHVVFWGWIVFGK
jgi:uncharacterized membrane protein YsdA (DUF1294 family)/cold shock CspA family protein